MTREELTGQRSLVFSKWIRSHLPDSASGFCVGNVDWVFWNFRTRQLLLAEEKTRRAQVRPWFERLMREVMDAALREFCWLHGIDYRGWHVIRFENESPGDGRVWLNDEEISVEALQSFLAMDGSALDALMAVGCEHAEEESK